MKAILAFFCVAAFFVQTVFAQEKQYYIRLAKEDKELKLLEKTLKGDSPISTKVGNKLRKGDHITISDELTSNAAFPIPKWKVEVYYNGNETLHNFFKGNAYEIMYVDDGKIEFTGEGGQDTTEFKDKISIILVNDANKKVDVIEFEKDAAESAQSMAPSFAVDLDKLQSCKTAYLESLATTEADANLMVFTAADPSNNTIGKIEMFRNYSMNGDVATQNTKGVYRDKDVSKIKKSTNKVRRGTAAQKTKVVNRGKGDLKLRKGTQLGALTTNYNILNYKVDVTNQSANYAFDNMDLISILQGKIPKLAEAAEEGSAAFARTENVEGDDEKKNQIKTLLQLYNTISNDIVELQTKPSVDYCMLNDYFLKIRTEMTANSIPVSLSLFSAYTNSRAEGQPDNVKEELNSLVELYKELFTFATPPAPVFPSIIPSKDYQQFNIVVKTVKDNQSIGAPEPVTAIVVGGWRTSFSGSILLHWLKDRKYYLIDGEVQQQEDETTVTLKRINRARDEEKGPVFAAGAQFNLYNQVGKAIGIGPSIGLASDIFSGNIDRLRFTLGGNILLTTSVGRFGINGGFIWGNVSKLQNGYEVATDANHSGYVLSSNEPPLREVWENSKFIGITYSLPTSAPAK